jgi:hypothetical protein
MLRDRLGVSDRCACRVVGQPSSIQRPQPKRAEDDAALRAELRWFSTDRRGGGIGGRISGCRTMAGR